MNQDLVRIRSLTPFPQKFNKTSRNGGAISVTYYSDAATLKAGIEASAKNAPSVDSVRYYGHQSGNPWPAYGEAHASVPLPHTGATDPASSSNWEIQPADLSAAVKAGKLSPKFETRSYGCNSLPFAQEMAKQTGAPAMGSDGNTDYSNVGGSRHRPGSDMVPTSANGYIHYDKTGTAIKQDAAGQRPSDDSVFKP